MKDEEVLPSAPSSIPVDDSSSSDEDENENGSTVLSLDPAPITIYEKFFFDFNEVYNFGKPTDIIRHVYNRYCVPDVITVFRHWNRRNPLEPLCINPVGLHNLVETVGFFDTVRYYSRAFSLIPDGVIHIQPSKICQTASFTRAVSNFVYKGTMIASIPKKSKRKRYFSSIEEECMYYSEMDFLRKRILDADLYGCVSNFKHPKSKRELMIQADKDAILQNVQHYQVSPPTVAPGVIEGTTGNPLNQLLRQSQNIFIGTDQPLIATDDDHKEGEDESGEEEEEEAEAKEKEGDKEMMEDVGETGELNSKKQGDPSSVVSVVPTTEMVTMDIYVKGMMVTYFDKNNRLYKIEFHYFVPASPSPTSTPTSTLTLTSTPLTASSPRTNHNTNGNYNPGSSSSPSSSTT